MEQKQFFTISYLINYFYVAHLAHYYNYNLFFNFLAFTIIGNNNPKSNSRCKNMIHFTEFQV